MSIFDRWRKPKKLELRLEQSQEQPTRHYLSSAIGPVVPGLEHREVNFGGANYVTVRGLRSTKPLAPVMTRWTLSSEARAAVADGADLYLELLTFGRAMQPILLSVGHDLDVDEVSAEYGFTPEKEKSENGNNQPT